MCSKTTINQIFWLDLWQGWHIARSLWGCCHSQHASPRDTLSTAEVPWHGYIPISLCALSLLLYSAPPRAAEEGCWVHLEWNKTRCLWLSQEPSMFWHHFALLQHLQASHHPSWYLQERPWHCPSIRWMPCCLCIQSAYPYLTMLCQYWVQATLLHFLVRAVLHICLWLWVHNREQPQTPWADYAQEPGRYTSPPPDNAVMPPGLWHSHQILTWQRDAHSRCPILLCPTCCPCNTSWCLCEPSPQSHHRRRLTSRDAMCSNPTLCALVEMILSGWPEDICDVPMNLCPYHHAHDVLTVEDGIILCGEGLVIPPWKETRCYSLSMKATKEYPNANTVPANVFIGLASIGTSNVLLKHVLHASAIAHRNLNSHSNQTWPLNAHDNTLELTSCTLMAMSTSSSLTITQRCPLSVRYLHPNAMLPRWYLPWRNCLLSMAHQSHSTVTMAPSLQVPSVQNLPLTGTSTIAPTNSHSNGQAEAAMKIIKGLFTWSKYSGQDPYLALLAYCITPMDAHMHSPGEMLYQHALCTTVP